MARNNPIEVPLRNRTCVPPHRLRITLPKLLRHRLRGARPRIRAAKKTKEGLAAVPRPAVHRVLFLTRRVEEEVGLDERARGLVQEGDVFVDETGEVAGFDVFFEPELLFGVGVAPD